MSLKFKSCLDMVLTLEGGFSDHPRDPGGATNKGITLKTYSRYLGRQATVDELKNIPMDHVENIYHLYYWVPLRCEEMPHPIDLLVFDHGVMSGFDDPAEIIQEIVGAKVDGIIGSKTLAALRNYLESYGAHTFILAYRSKKIHRFEALPHFNSFGSGWRNRDTKIVGYALDKVSGEQ